MRYLVKFYTGISTSYIMDIFLEENSTNNKDVPLRKLLQTHMTVMNELEHNKDIHKVQFFKAIPELVTDHNIK